MSKKYYSTSETAKILNLSRIAVFKQIKSGKIIAEKVGRNYIVPHEAIRESLGETIGRNKKKVEEAISKAVSEYGEVFRRLGKE